MKPFGRLLLGFGLLILAPLDLSAQESGEAEVQAVIERLFDGMREGDSSAVRSTLHPEARLQSAVVRDGRPQLVTGSIDDFVRAVGTPHEQVWDERIAGLDIEIDEPLASARMRYRFHLGDAFSHCGVNFMHLVRTDDGWRIVQIIDTRRAECPV